ncbi:MAG: hypothetical protein M1821_004457 [Bathelium mastoideum]|nr:MAG: hypothetical protein M1821_004457 [Bathelium mastoideum]
MSQHLRHPKTSDYGIGWICALHVELAAAEALMDERFELPSDIRIPASDTNTYRVGRIAQHNVVMACCPAGVTGTTSAAVVAANMLSVFDSIRVGLMVGIGGGIPSEEHDIRLGDVVVSQPSDTNGGVIQYDYGKTLSGNQYMRKGALNKPPGHLLTAIESLKANQERLGTNLHMLLDEMVHKSPHMEQNYKHQGALTDLLYESDYEHAHDQTDCSRCDRRRLVSRRPRETNIPHVHYGAIGSANTVLRDAQLRDRLWKEMHIICVEMEAAGLMDNFPCLVIRGVSDYADSHKHKFWQPYAAATASAYAKDLLGVVNKESIARASPARPVLQIQMSPEVGFGLIAIFRTLMETRHHQVAAHKAIELPNKQDPSLQPLSQQSTLVDDSSSISPSPELTLRVPRIINGNADIFIFAEQGNMVGIQRLFERRQASVDDVASSTGRTALHYAIVYNKVNLCRFLLKQGAKRDAEDKDRQSSVELAWIRIFGKLADERALEAMQTLFEDEEFFETREFPPLHKIVLGLNGTDLALHLQLTTSTINDVDADGRTALSWAAARGDDQILLQLLKSGADPNKPAPCGRTPLHWASQSSSMLSIKWLLHYAADVNAVDKWLRTPLIYASCNHALDDPSLIQLIVDTGANLDFQDCRERTALGYAVKHNQPLTCAALLEAGANLNLADNWGFKPLFEALKPEYASTLDCLLKHAKNWSQPLSGTTINNQSILHLLAAQADSATLERFNDADFAGVDYDLQDEDGHTADILLRQRGDAESVRAPFAVIYERSKSHNRTYPAHFDGFECISELNESDEMQEQYFYDALEDLQIHDYDGPKSKLDDLSGSVRIIEIADNFDLD